MFGLELKRAMCNRRTVGCLLLGCVVAVIHVAGNLIGKVEFWNMESLFIENSYVYPSTVFNEWMGGNTYNLEGFFYFMVFPILTALPFGMSYFEDMAQGVVKQVYTKVERGTYLRAKYAAVFLTAGMVFVVPLVFNFLICMTLLSSLRPEPLAAKGMIYSAVLWYEIYETHPFIYVLIFLTIDFIFAGCLATVSLTAALFTEKKIVALITPFILHVFAYSVCMMTGAPNGVMYSPVYFLFAGAGCVTWWLFVFYGLFFLICGTIYYVLGKTSDCF